MSIFCGFVTLFLYGFSYVTAHRCRAADRKGKTAILDEFTATTGYNRKYALHILVNWDKPHFVALDGQTAGLKAGRPKQKLPNGRYKKIYDVPKTPAQRLLDNPDIADMVKVRLRDARARTNPVVLRRLELAALAKLDLVRHEKERLLRGQNRGAQG